ncbi:hypothetical protein BRC68_07900 [Halobacteriales archaeon QH_6_64_20]|nr:MAG: hypothetical protein BRC68_07900 [Halobacteriales archaeon QH_6_64_20]
MVDPMERGVIGGLDLTSDRYVVKQSYIRSKYRVEDDAGTTVLKGKKKRFRLREEFPFTDPDGNVLFRLKARNVFDVAGNYTLIDEASGEAFAVIEKAYTLFKHVYRIRSPDGRLLATIESESALVMAAKEYIGVLGLLPHSYSISGPDGSRIGTIEETFSVRDSFVVEVGDTGDASREAILAAAIAIDALEDD